MTWMVWYNALMRYYPGLNLLNIPKMTIWQFVESIKNMGWLEQQSERATNRNAASAPEVFGQVAGKVPSTSEIRRMARQINPDLVIPKG